LGRVGSRRSDPATAIAERVAFGRVPDKMVGKKGAPTRLKAGGRDSSLHRARVLEVRIRLPPAVSQANFRIAPLARPISSNTSPNCSSHFREDRLTRPSPTRVWLR